MLLCLCSIPGVHLLIVARGYVPNVCCSCLYLGVDSLLMVERWAEVLVTCFFGDCLNR